METTSTMQMELFYLGESYKYISPCLQNLRKHFNLVFGTLRIQRRQIHFYKQKTRWTKTIRIYFKKKFSLFLIFGGREKMTVQNISIL